MAGKNDLVIKHAECLIDAISTLRLLYLDQIHNWMQRASHTHACAYTKAGICLVSHPSLNTFHSTAELQWASYLITVWARTVNSEYTGAPSLH